MLVSVIIVSYNTAELTLKAVDSVIKEASSSKTLSSDTEIIVVDNNSKDNSVKHLKQKARTSSIPLIVLAQTKNVGFGRANNAGIQKAKGEYLFFLNSDATLEKGSLEQLLKSFTSHPSNELTAQDALTTPVDRLGMVAAKLLNPDGSDQHQGGDIPSLLSLAGHQLLLDDIPLLGNFIPSTQHTGHKGNHINHEQKNDTLVSKDWVAATAVMVKKELIEEIGSFDPAIFMYGEDMEWCIRARHHHWDVAINQKAPVTHLGSASSSSKNALIGEAKAYIYIWAKHFPAWQMPFATAIIKLGSLIRWGLFGTMGKHQRALIYKELVMMALDS